MEEEIEAPLALVKVVEGDIADIFSQAWKKDGKDNSTYNKLIAGLDGAGDLTEALTQMLEVLHDLGYVHLEGRKEGG